MRILQLGKFYPIRGGVEKVMSDFTIGLNSIGVYCDMLCVHKPDGGFHSNKVDFGTHLILCNKTKEIARTVFSIDMVRKLRKLSRNYDIIHIHHPDPMASLALFLSGYKGRVVLHWHSDILKQKLLLKLYKPLQSWLLRRSDIIIGTTPKYINESPFLRKYISYKTDFVPIGVDPVISDSNIVEQIKKRYKNRKIVFSIGRLVTYKGYDYLLDATKTLDDNVILLIGGKGPLYGHLQSRIKKEKLEHKVKLLGFLSNMEKNAYFEACDIFCLSSTLKTEAYAIVQIEAMSCYKPVVSTNIPGSGVPWVNKNGESGIVVEPHNPGALSSAINNLVRDEHLYNSLCMGARKRYEFNFRKESMIKKMYNIYQKLI